MLEIGSLVDGKYKILSKVGQGGMSVVYMAINEKLIRLGLLRKYVKTVFWILKLLNRDLLLKPTFSKN